MVKIASKYILSLCILLFTGYSHLFAYTVHNTFAADASAQDQTNIAELDHYELSAGVLTSKTEKENGKELFEFAEEEEVEENKESTSKKLLEISDFYTTLLDTEQAQFYSHFIKSRLSFCERTSYFSSEEPLNVEFGVFRI